MEYHTFEVRICMIILSLVLSVISAFLSLIAIVFVVNLWLRVMLSERSEPPKAQEIRSASSYQRGDKTSTCSGRSGNSARDVPRLSPQEIAPSLAKPPRPKGGFGTKNNP
jgi:hypothetical protein